jgi:hypothetical protein
MNKKIRLAMKAIFGIKTCQSVLVRKRITPNEYYIEYTITFYTKNVK